MLSDTKQDLLLKNFVLQAHGKYICWRPWFVINSHRRSLSCDHAGVFYCVWWLFSHSVQCYFVIW